MITCETNEPTVVLDEDVDEETQYCPFYRVLLHNDDVNSMDHVVFVIQDVFCFDVQKAAEIMMEAHASGVALCKVEPLEHAEWHCQQLLDYSLTATIEPES